MTVRYPKEFTEKILREGVDKRMLSTRALQQLFSVKELMESGWNVQWYSRSRYCWEDFKKIGESKLDEGKKVFGTLECDREEIWHDCNKKI